MTKGANNKDITIRLRVTAKDKAKIESRANKQGQSMSDYIRAKTL